MFLEFVFMEPLLTLQRGSAACSVLTLVFLCYFFHLLLPTRPLCFNTRGPFLYLKEK